ncbi:Crossover junction endonuclease MUS81 [Perkinsela sp. CCAP 1560/4]|nr:Crossover junction endonuclease MUS81 [Perkinsela sp. CCAP 1560/4]|eukprot:KNH06875.1 Crossover junction endonuclease MUS81 [Perkinsela sp. CCAP 1560/4]
MEPNSSIVKIICELLKKYNERPSDEYLCAWECRINCQPATEFDVDDLITAKDSLQKYPIPVENLFEELFEIDGFSQKLVNYVIGELSTSYFQFCEYPSRGGLEKETPNTEKTRKERAHLLHILEPMRIKLSFDVTLVVDTRERGRSSTLCEHLSRGRGVNANTKKGLPKNGDFSESSFDELLHECLDSAKMKPLRRKVERSTCKSKDVYEYAVKESLLPVGDMIWMTNEMSSPNSFVLPLIVERKTIADLASSLVDGRFHAQAERISSSGLPWVLYILEGSLDDSEQCSVPAQAIRTAVHTLVQTYHVYVYNTNSLRETIFLLRYVTRCLKTIVSTYDIFKLVANFTRRSYDEWTSYIREQDLQRNRSNCFRNMLSIIDGVGPEAADKISRVFESPLQIFNHFHSVIAMQDEIHAEFCLTSYCKTTSGTTSSRPIKLCSGAASSAVYKAFYAEHN